MKFVSGLSDLISDALGDASEWFESASRGQIAGPFGLTLWTDAATNDLRRTMMQVGVASVTAAPPGVVATLRTPGSKR